MSKLNYEYDDMIKDFGEPLEIVEIEQDGKYHCIYDGIIFTYPLDKSHRLNYMRYLTLSASKYTFGSKNIGIGSSFLEVMWAYKYTDLLQLNKDSIRYKDDNFPITFYFNTNNKVEKIVIETRFY